MKSLLLYMFLIAVFLPGCARNYYNVPAGNFADKVKVLGIAPILIDNDSDINYPQKDLLIQLASELNRKFESQLVRKLKNTGNFYTVTLVDSEPVKLFSSLIFRREKRDDATIQYNKYFWKNDELRSYILKNRLDAVMLVTVSGLTMSDKIYSSNLLKSLISDYNYLTLTAQILDANGTILWEYPNFRRHFLSYTPLLNLQYPDFSESDANLSKKTAVKFKTLEGIRLTLEQKHKDWLLRETQEPEAYGAQFDAIVSLIKFDSGNETKETSTSTELPRQRPVEAYKPAELKPEAPAATKSPATTAVLPQIGAVPAKTEVLSAVPATTADGNIPSTGNTR